MLLEDSKSVKTLLSDTLDQLGLLMRSELRLVQAELSAKAAEAGRGAAYIAVAGILVIPTAVMLLLTLALWLNQMGISIVLSHLIATLLGAVVSIAFAMVGFKRLKPKNLKLTRTARQLDQDLAVVRELAR